MSVMAVLFSFLDFSIILSHYPFNLIKNIKTGEDMFGKVSKVVLNCIPENTSDLQNDRNDDEGFNHLRTGFSQRIW